jgi:hypothetical protein
MTKSSSAATTRATIDTPKDVLRFRKAAKVYVREATTSKKSAHRELMSLGIYTAKGNLTKNYK